MEVGARVGTGHAGPGPLGPSDTTSARPASAPVTRHASRVTPSAPSTSLSPRSAELELARSGTASCLLLPSLAARGGEAGAIVGDTTGTARNITLTTVNYLSLIHI